MASIEFVPPEGIEAWRGGIIHSESFQHHHAVAWLLDQEANGAIEISGSADEPELKLMQSSPTDPLVKLLFNGSDHIRLGEYSSSFAKDWDAISEKLSEALEDTNYWEEKSRKRKKRFKIVGWITLIVGLILGALFAIALPQSPDWTTAATVLVMLGIFAVAIGVGLSLLLNSWELLVRTPRSSGLWILLESFRRFIRDSDATHVEAAAKNGRLKEYSAWATTFDEAEHWQKLVTEASENSATVADNVSSFSTASLVSAVASTRTAPSSSSSGSSGGGGVGGGSGGGGGGSW